MPRALKNLDITFGLATVPVQLFTATSPQGVAFNVLHARCGTRIQLRLECPEHGMISRDETVKAYEHAKDEYVRFTPDELKALEQAATSALIIDGFLPHGAIDPVYFEHTYYLGAGKDGARGYRLLVEALRRSDRVAVGTFTWRGKTTPIAIRSEQDGLILQRLFFADEVHDRMEIEQGAAPKLREQERTLAERLIEELSAAEFHPEAYEDDYRKRVLKAIEQKAAGQEIQRIEVDARPSTTDLVATLKASLGRKPLAKTASAADAAPPTKIKRPVRRQRAS
ncbi:MAG TPA: Ku protein [Methylomirabilota bacterium]|jgi:DNA end-binding protein Ku|nr:Ku protein [Methylomirabilota bacterium]